MAPPLMNLSIYYLVTKTMGCYALGGYKNIVTKKERKREWLQNHRERESGYKTIENGYKVRFLRD